MVRKPDATMQPALQDNQLMSKHRVLSFRPQLRLEWRGRDDQSETEQPDHSASLGDSITSSTRIGFSVHTGASAQRSDRARTLLRHQAAPSAFHVRPEAACADTRARLEARCHRQALPLRNARRVTQPSRRFHQRSPIDVFSIASPKSPVSSSLVEVVPRMIIRLPHLQPGKIVFNDAKGLQHYRHQTDSRAVPACPLSRDELDSAYEFTTRRAAIQRSASAWLRSLWNGCGRPPRSNGYQATF